MLWGDTDSGKRFTFELFGLVVEELVTGWAYKDKITREVHAVIDVFDEMANRFILVDIPVNGINPHFFLGDMPDQNHRFSASGTD